MPVFLGTHNFGQPLSDEQMAETWKNYREACEKHGAKGLKVYFNLEQGKAFCVTEAASAAEVDAAHADVGKPTDELTEVQKLQ